MSALEHSAPEKGQIQPVAWEDHYAATDLRGGHESSWAAYQEDLRTAMGQTQMNEQHGNEHTGVHVGCRGWATSPPVKLEVQLVGREPAIHNDDGSVVATAYEVKCNVNDEDIPLGEVEFLYWFRDRDTNRKLYYAGRERRNKIVVRKDGCFWVQARRVRHKPYYGVTEWGPEVRVTPHSLGTPTHRNY